MIGIIRDSVLYVSGGILSVVDNKQDEVFPESDSVGASAGFKC